MQGPADPVFMTSTWVYAPVEIAGWRPKSNSSWEKATTKDMKYQTLYVSSPGKVSNASVTDSLILWNEKPEGITGNCTLIGFNSAKAPAIDTPVDGPGQWKTFISDDCTNVNLWDPYTWFQLSDDGSVAVAWVMLSSGNYTIYVLDGQSGQLMWQKDFGCNPVVSVLSGWLRDHQPATPARSDATASPWRCRAGQRVHPPHRPITLPPPSYTRYAERPVLLLQWCGRVR